MRNVFYGFLFLITFCITHVASAASYMKPPEGDDIIGHADVVLSASGDSLESLARKFDCGYNELRDANPRARAHGRLRQHTEIIIPTRYILPQDHKVGVVINLAEMRLYYFPKEGKLVYTYPIGIGRLGRMTPTGKTFVRDKKKDPWWTPPDSIREYNLKKGIDLPPSLPPGPDNPLGGHAVYLKLASYLIHGTIHPASIGRRASFGCIRMYPEDIKNFFSVIKKGVPVEIINVPFKIGVENGKVYLEMHKVLKEQSAAYADGDMPVMMAVDEFGRDRNADIDLSLVEIVVKGATGIPTIIGTK